MADNERIVYTSGNIGYEQQAPSQAARTQFTPGKKTSRALDMNWPKDYKIPVGNKMLEPLTEGLVNVLRVRVIKLHRNTVSDQTIPAPTYNAFGDTVTQNNDGTLERTAGC